MATGDITYGSTDLNLSYNYNLLNSTFSCVLSDSLSVTIYKASNSTYIANIINNSGSNATKAGAEITDFYASTNYVLDIIKHSDNQFILILGTYQSSLYSFDIKLYTVNESANTITLNDTYNLLFNSVTGYGNGFLSKISSTTYQVCWGDSTVGIKFNTFEISNNAFSNKTAGSITSYISPVRQLNLSENDNIVVTRAVDGSYHDYYINHITKSGSTYTLTATSSVIINNITQSYRTRNLNIVKIDDTHAVLVYKNNSGNIVSRTISIGSLTIGDETVITTGANNVLSLSDMGDTVLISYYNASTYGSNKFGTKTSTDITWGSAVNFTSTAISYYYTDTLYIGGGKNLISYGNSSNSNYIKIANVEIPAPDALPIAWDSEQSLIDSDYYTTQIPNASGCKLSDNKVVIAYTISDSSLGLKVGTWDGSAWTWGSEYTQTTAWAGYGIFAIASIDSSKFILSYYTAGGWAVRVGVVTDLAIAWGDINYIMTTYKTAIGGTALVKINTNRFAVLHGVRISSTNNSMAQRILTISSNTISKSGSETTVTSFGSDATGMNSIYKGILLDTNSWCWARHQNNSTNLVLTNKYTSSSYTISSTTMSSTSNSGLPSSTSVQGNADIVALDTNKILCAYKSSSSGNIVGKIVTVGTSAYTWGTEQDITSDSDDLATLQQIILTKKTSQLIKMVYNYSTSNYRRIKNISINASTITASSSYSYSNEVATIYSSIVPVNDTTSMFMYKDYSSPYYLKYAMFSEQETQPFDEEYTANGTITLSSSFTYEMEDASKEYTASGTITASSSFVQEIDREIAISGTINISSSFDYSYELTQLDVVEVANGSITLSSAFTSAFSIGRDSNGTITLSSAFTKAFDITKEISGSIDVSGDFDYEEVNAYSYNGTGTVNISSNFTKAFDITRSISGNITVSSNFVEVISVIETANGLIEVSGTFDYSNRPIFTKTITGTIHTSSSFNYYYYDEGPVVVYFDKLKQQTNTLNEDYNEKEAFCWLTANKVLRLYTKGSTSNKAMYGQYIDIDGDKNITLSTPALILNEGTTFTNFYQTKIVKVKDDMVLYNSGGNHLSSLTINQTNNTFSSTYRYVISNTGDQVGAVYEFMREWGWDVFSNNTRVKVLYDCSAPASGTSGARVANGTINANNTITWAYQLALWPTGSQTDNKMLKVRDDAFIWKGNGQGICIVESDNTCTKYTSSTTLLSIDDLITLSSDRVLGKSSNGYRIYTTTGTTISQSSEFTAPTGLSFDSDDKIDSSLTTFIAETLAYNNNILPNGSIQQNIQHIPKQSNVYYQSLISAYDRSIGLIGAGPTLNSFYSGYIPVSFEGQYSFGYTGSGSIETSSSFDYVWYPDFIITIEGITIYASSDVIPYIGIDRDISGTITLSSDNIYQVEYIKEVSGLITLTSDFTYEEDNFYSYIVNGDINLSSDFTNINNYGYLNNADGVITLSSVEDVYPELLRDVSGLINLTSDFTYEEYNEYPYSGSGVINLSSSFPTENNYDYLVNADGTITVSSSTYYEANSFEYILAGVITVSSDFTTSNYYEYITNAQGLITTSSIQSTQIDYDRTVNGVITVFSIELAYPGVERDVSGQITLSSDFDYELYSRDYLYDFNGLITLTSDFDYEEVNEYPYIGTGTIVVTGYFPEEVTTYKYHIEGTIAVSSGTTYTWLADSKEVIYVSSLINKQFTVESVVCNKIIVKSLINRKNKSTSYL